MKCFRKPGVWGLLVIAAYILLIHAASVRAEYIEVYSEIPWKENSAVQFKKGFAENDGKGNTIYTSYLYRLSIPADGYITIKMNAKNDSSNYLDASLIQKKGSVYKFRESWGSSTGSASFKIPVSKGTWFIRGTGGASGSYTFTKQKQGTNFCADQAAALKSNTKVKICQTPNSNFGRWYKITLKNKKKVTISFDADTTVEFFDEDMVLVQSFTKKYTSSEKLKKGTYYICVTRNQSKDYSVRYYLGTLSWKQG